MSFFKTCSRCGKIHSAGAPCTCKKIYLGGKERELRNTNEWHKKAEEVKKERLFCQVCAEEGFYNYKNLEVHHIEKVRDAQEKLTDENNLSLLCTYHHKLADAGKIKAGYLRELNSRRKVPPQGVAG